MQCNKKTSVNTQSLNNPNPTATSAEVLIIVNCFSIYLDSILEMSVTSDNSSGKCSIKTGISVNKYTWYLHLPLNSKQRSFSLLTPQVLCPKNRLFTPISIPFLSMQQPVLWRKVWVHLQSSMCKLLDHNFSDNSSTTWHASPFVVLLFRFVRTSWNLPCSHFYPKSFSTLLWHAISRSSACGNPDTKIIQKNLSLHCKMNLKEKEKT